MYKIGKIQEYFHDSWKFIVDIRVILRSLMVYWYYLALILIILVDMARLDLCKYGLKTENRTISAKNLGQFTYCVTDQRFEFDPNYSWVVEIFKASYCFMIYSSFNSIIKNISNNDVIIGLLFSVATQFDVIPNLHLAIRKNVLELKSNHNSSESLNAWTLSHPIVYQEPDLPTIFLPLVLPSFYLCYNFLWPFCKNFHNKLIYLYSLVAPWQPAWGAIRHAILQPLIAPHSGLILAGIFWASLAGSPTLSLYGSAMLVPTFARMYKFWDRSSVKAQVDTQETGLIYGYFGKRTENVDKKMESHNNNHGNETSDEEMDLKDKITETRLDIPENQPLKDSIENINDNSTSKMECPGGPIDRHDIKLTASNPSNAIYIQLLCGILEQNLADMIHRGEFGSDVKNDDFFLLRSTTTEDYLLIVHIISINEQRVTFQIRGLEFAGTYCQQEELGALDDTSYNKFSPNYQFINYIFNFFGNIFKTYSLLKDDILIPAYSLASVDASNFLTTDEMKSAMVEQLSYSTIFYLLKFFYGGVDEEERKNNLKYLKSRRSLLFEKIGENQNFKKFCVGGIHYDKFLIENTELQQDNFNLSHEGKSCSIRNSTWSANRPSLPAREAHISEAPRPVLRRNSQTRTSIYRRRTPAAVSISSNSRPSRPENQNPTSSPNHDRYMEELTEELESDGLAAQMVNMVSQMARAGNTDENRSHLRDALQTLLRSSRKKMTKSKYNRKKKEYHDLYANKFDEKYLPFLKKVAERMIDSQQISSDINQEKDLQQLLLLANAIVFSFSLEMGLVKAIDMKKLRPISKNSNGTNKCYKTWNCLLNSANIGERNRTLKKIYTNFSGIAPNPEPFNRAVFGPNNNHPKKELLKNEIFVPAIRDMLHLQSEYVTMLMNDEDEIMDVLFNQDQQHNRHVLPESDDRWWDILVNNIVDFANKDRIKKMKSNSKRDTNEALRKTIGYQKIEATQDVSIQTLRYIKPSRSSATSGEVSFLNLTAQDCYFKDWRFSLFCFALIYFSFLNDSFRQNNVHKFCNFTPILTKIQSRILIHPRFLIIIPTIIHTSRNRSIFFIFVSWPLRFFIQNFIKVTFPCI